MIKTKILCEIYGQNGGFTYYLESQSINHIIQNDKNENCMKKNR